MTIVGGPGTRIGMTVRMARGVLSAASIAFISCTPRSSHQLVFNFFICAMAIQVLWSLQFICYDIKNLRVSVYLQNRTLLTIFTIYDWVFAYLTVAAAVSTLAVVTFFAKDSGLCQYLDADCRNVTVSGLMALVAGLLSIFSALVMLGTRASLVHQD